MSTRWNKQDDTITCDGFLSNIPGVHSQGLVGLLPAKNKIHAVFRLGVAHLHCPTVDFHSEGALEQGGGGIDRDKVDKAEATAHVAAPLPHDAHLPDTGAVTRQNSQNRILVGMDVEALAMTSIVRKINKQKVREDEKCKQKACVSTTAHLHNQRVAGVDALLHVQGRPVCFSSGRVDELGVGVTRGIALLAGTALGNRSERLCVAQLKPVFSWAEQGAATTFAKFTKLQSAHRQSSTTC